MRVLGDFLRGAVLGLLPIVVPAGGSPGMAGAVELPEPSEIEDAIPQGDSLTGREIYERFLENKLHSAVQHQSIVSTDPGGSQQTTRFWVRWKDYRDENGDPSSEGVVAKTLIKFMDPFDMRNTGYLVITHENRTSDQFVYRQSDRRIRRVQLRGVGVMGSDYTFNDIEFQNVEDADYVRLPDEIIDDEPVYVVEATLKPFVDSHYAKVVVYLEQEHYVPLRARYWDQAGVENREMRARASSIREFKGVWVATESTMVNLREGTRSTLHIEKLDPNLEIADALFSTFRLQLRR